MCQYEYVIKIHSKTQKTAPWELIDFDSQNCYFRKSKLISKVKKKLKVLELDDTYALPFD